jgi:hypothetical protein
MALTGPSAEHVTGATSIWVLSSVSDNASTQQGQAQLCRGDRVHSLQYAMLERAIHRSKQYGIHKVLYMLFISKHASQCRTNAARLFVAKSSTLQLSMATQSHDPTRAGFATQKPPPTI